MSDDANKPRWVIYTDPNPVPKDMILRWPDGTPYRTRSVLLPGFVYAPRVPELPEPPR